MLQTSLYGPTFNDTYLEKRMGVKRLRLLETGFDPNLIDDMQKQKEPKSQEDEQL